MEHRREPAVAGSFYPRTCAGIKRIIASFDRRLQAKGLKTAPNIVPRALIVPHAGWIYSGYTAYLAYRLLPKSRAHRIVVLGPSHRVYFQGISAGYYETFATPCGDLPIDTVYQTALAKHFPIGFVPQVHQREHSTEVQMPFIRHYRPDAKVIELIYGDVRLKTLARIALAVLSDPDNLLVVSSDLSHYYPLQTAEQRDRHCIQAVIDHRWEDFKRCEACGKRGIEALAIAADHLKLHMRLLHYTTSADASRDTSSVVGYMSVAFY